MKLQRIFLILQCNHLQNQKYFNRSVDKIPWMGKRKIRYNKKFGVLEDYNINKRESREKWKWNLAVV